MDETALLQMNQQRAIISMGDQKDCNKCKKDCRADGGSRRACKTECDALPVCSGGNNNGRKQCIKCCQDSGGSKCVGKCRGRGKKDCCGEDDCGDEPTPDEPTPGGCQNTLDKFTPCQALSTDLNDWNSFNSRPLESSQVSGHDPDDIEGVNWNAAEWDGEIYRPDQMSTSDFYDAICPVVVTSGWPSHMGFNTRTIRGLREAFYAMNNGNGPFTDNQNPTMAEVDAWHVHFLRHMRALVGYTDYGPELDHCLYAGAQWFNERKQTAIHDNQATDKPVCCHGPCPGGQIQSCQGGQSKPAQVCSSHCGIGFFPPAEYKQPYLPSGHPECSESGAEGIFGMMGEAPWSVRVAASLCGTLDREGFWGGHLGPIWRRQKIGWSFWRTSGGAILRSVGGGELYDHKYQER